MPADCPSRSEELWVDLAQKSTVENGIKEFTPKSKLLPLVQIEGLHRRVVEQLLVICSELSASETRAALMSLSMALHSAPLKTAAMSKSNCI